MKQRNARSWLPPLAIAAFAATQVGLIALLVPDRPFVKATHQEPSLAGSSVAKAEQSKIDPKLTVSPPLMSTDDQSFVKEGALEGQATPSDEGTDNDSALDSADEEFEADDSETEDPLQMSSADEIDDGTLTGEANDESASTSSKEEEANEVTVTEFNSLEEAQAYLTAMEKQYGSTN